MARFCLDDKDHLKLIIQSFNILSEQNRIKMLCLLGKKDKLCVCEIAEILNLKQNLVSHHLSVIKKIGLIETEKDSRKIYYKINQKTYNNLKNIIGEIFNF